MNIVFVIARNASGRPTALHELRTGSARSTRCGREMAGWSLCYVPETIANNALAMMRCGNCARTRREARRRVA